MTQLSLESIRHFVWIRERLRCSGDDIIFLAFVFISRFFLLALQQLSDTLIMLFASFSFAGWLPMGLNKPRIMRLDVKNVDFDSHFCVFHFRLAMLNVTDLAQFDSLAA